MELADSAGGVQVVLEVCHGGLRTVVVRYGHRPTEPRGFPGGRGVRGTGHRGPGAQRCRAASITSSRVSGSAPVGDHPVARLLAAGADLIALGRPFLANPDLVARLRLGAPLNPVRDRYLMYVGGADGYTDYPTLDELAGQPSRSSMRALDGGRVA
ncbi:hypothetical protein GCM10027074_45590 [Streptomyces deserti]